MFVRPQAACLACSARLAHDAQLAQYTQFPHGLAHVRMSAFHPSNHAVPFQKPVDSLDATSGILGPSHIRGCVGQGYFNRVKSVLTIGKVLTIGELITIGVLSPPVVSCELPICN